MFESELVEYSVIPLDPAHEVPPKLANTIDGLLIPRPELLIVEDYQSYFNSRLHNGEWKFYPKALCYAIKLAYVGQSQHFGAAEWPNYSSILQYIHVYEGECIALRQCNAANLWLEILDQQTRNPGVTAFSFVVEFNVLSSQFGDSAEWATDADWQGIFGNVLQREPVQVNSR